MVKINIVGKEKRSWSVSKDRYYTEKAFSELKYQLTKTFINADIIYSVWYSYLLSKKMFFLRHFKSRRKIIAVVTNNIENSVNNFNTYKHIVDSWVFANTEQQKYLLKQGIPKLKTFFNPYYVDENVFFKLNKSKKEIADLLNINFNLIKNKLTISSFQRDSLGKDLSKPKPQKNPQMLINLLKKADNKKFILLLAGPRRHFLINSCRKHKIPYLFIGNEAYIDKMEDDIGINNLPENTINKLYNLSDLYLITSNSEGGPKAVIETALTKTPVLSTPVGFAPDFLSSDTLCSNENMFSDKLEIFFASPDFLNNSVKENYENVNRINNFEAYKSRLRNIIETIANDR